MDALRYMVENVEPWDWAEDAGMKVLPIIRNRAADPDERLAAVEIAGDFTQINDDLAVALIGVIEDPAESDEIRARAAISFGPALEQGFIDEFDDPESVPISEEMFERVKGVLKRVYMDDSAPKEVRRRALEGSIRAPEEWHKEEVRKAYASGDAEWQLTAVFCMSHIRGFNAEILEALKSKDPLIHLEAVQAAGSFEVAEAWPHIAALARSEQTEKVLRITAIEALSTLMPKESLPILIELSEDPDEEIAEAADEAQSMAVGFLDDGEEDDEFDEDEEFEDEDEDEEEDKPSDGKSK